MVNERYLLNFQTAVTAIAANKLRALLTALGIIFGVAAVILMLAIGKGTQQEIMEQIKLVGVNNIIIAPVVEQKDEKLEENPNKPVAKKFSPGLTIKDAISISEVLPSVNKMSPEIILETIFIKDGYNRTGKLVGVEPDYFDISDFKIEQGSMFNQHHLVAGDQVCIIGKSVQSRFFSKEDPLGKYIKCGKSWLKVIGVLKEKNITQKSRTDLGIRDYNMDIYTPLRTMLLRYKNRSLITKAKIQAASGNNNNDDQPATDDKEAKNQHQIDRLVVQVKNTEDLRASAEVISRMLKRRHFNVTDYEISIPELLLKQQQNTKDIFNILLGFIAGISLVVGGIGIMNIMLASVLERIKEIGVRLAIGAKRTDIIQQFLFEAVLVSVAGGIVGIITGVALSFFVSGVLGITTIISYWSITISFGVSALVGLIFGIAPARSAAEQDPIKSLRYE